MRGAETNELLLLPIVKRNPDGGGEPQNHGLFILSMSHGGRLLSYRCNQRTGLIPARAVACVANLVLSMTELVLLHNGTSWSLGIQGEVYNHEHTT